MKKQIKKIKTKLKFRNEIEKKTQKIAAKLKIIKIKLKFYFAIFPSSENFFSFRFSHFNIMYLKKKKSIRN